MTGVSWTESEIRFLRENYKSMTNQQLADLLPNRTRNAVSLKKGDLGLRSPLPIRKFRLTELDLGILVGLVEGEGGMGILAHKYPYGRYLRPYIVISNKELQILKWIRSKLKVGSISNPRKQEIFHYQLTGQRSILPLLETLRPYLITDRRRKMCDLIIEFCRRRIKAYWNGPTPYCKRDIEIFLDLRRLNRKGPDPKVPKLLKEISME